ncbi:Hypothetical predicted protein [Octopus vulgaris]|uniref:Uncharacterized protein n=1 Tax=Octopus vulgaris TaxID=6645 RepID=A0AA36EX88_OCTVU|nr:Hypothetical predicted protein [Octopus vulgaris]
MFLRNWFTFRCPVFVVGLSFKVKDRDKVTKYGCHADDGNRSLFSYSFNHSSYHTDIIEHRCEGNQK